ncbi:predicted protein [Histoplasma capsulatum G186AR]|uniref:Uncharacterized protein n=1 Tax=Ajellomyces capsulatus (strain G186AR / H82 / ATCC MYA-2454 / RMSCC 2432) TaxID=447093 RepID=C0NI01_AJECG|nr:uncharacterized protein HCBG_02973 [Histoplasma capsulatum G186AR]EEH09437.1 predicted protein [Histoplasma capsulatum G186AR]
MGTRRGQLEILDGQMGMAKSDKSSREELMKWKWKWKKPGRGWSRMLRPAGDWRGGLAAEQPNTNITNLTAVQSTVYGCCTEVKYAQRMPLNNLENSQGTIITKENMKELEEFLRIRIAVFQLQEIGLPQSSKEDPKCHG